MEPAMKTFKQISTYLLLGMMLLAFSTNLNARAKKDSSDSFKKGPVPGSFSLYFGISNRFTLQSFDGTTIFGKYQKSRKSAFRGGLSLEGRHYDLDYPSLDRETVNNTVSMRIVVQYMRYLTMNKNVSLYYAIGPMLALGYYEVKEEIPGLDNPYWRAREIYFGMQGNWAVEWFISKSFSLVGEYGAILVFHGRGFNGRQRIIIGPQKPAEYSLRLTFDLVKFGLAVYF